jgi:signal transduction histidine kinase
MLLVLLLVSSGLSCTSLLIVRYSVQRHVRDALTTDLDASVSAFKNAQHLRELTLARSAQLLASLPTLKALMTTRDALTINDASVDFWNLSGSDILVLADRTGNIVALHARRPGITPQIAQTLLSESITQELSTDWWFGYGQLYQVAVRPIYLGPESEHNTLGVVVVGYEMNDKIAAEVGAVARGDVAFCYGDKIVTTSLTPARMQQMSQVLQKLQATPTQVELGGEQFLGKSIRLPPNIRQVSLAVLGSVDQATEFLRSLNRLLLALGAVTLLLGAGLVVLTSNAVTRPIGKLINGVHALQKGDYSYPLVEHGSREVAQLIGAFRHMRDTLQQTQRELLHAERMAMIGQMAGSISHDMRHQLSAVFANAEFLCSTKLTTAEREELFSEIRIAVNEMTDLVDSMLEFSRTQTTLRAAPGNLVTVLEHAIRTVKSHPEHRNCDITLCSCEVHPGNFDARRLERAFYNLLLNAVEAVSTQADGEERVQVIVMQDDLQITTRIIDTGPGIPSEIENTLFDPFVGFGKEHGTGLGLTIARKILQDHGGEVEIESTARGRTVFVVMIPVLGTGPAKANPPVDRKTSITKPEA